MILVYNLNETQRHILITALHTAASVYDEHGFSFGESNPVMSMQFRKQAEAARDMVDRIENSQLIQVTEGK